MAKNLTIKQKKFVKAYVETDGNGTEAALKSYDTTDYQTANAISVENLQKPSIKEAIELALVKHNITMDAAIKPIADGLHATRTIGFGEEAMEAVDHSTRLKASGMALKLMGAEKNGEEPKVNLHLHLEEKRKRYIDGDTV